MEQIANNWPGLAEKVLAIPRCLSCRDGLRKKAEGLGCSGCGRKCSLVNGVLPFVDMQQYAGSFGFHLWCRRSACLCWQQQAGRLHRNDQ